MPPDLAELYAAAAAAHPGIAVSREELAAALAAKIDEPPTPEGAAELYLALACARGEPAAIAVFDRDYLSVIPAALAATKLPAATIEDIRAAVRDKLLLAEDGRPPRIVDYAGRGRMRGLVQVTASRLAIDRIRHDSREQALPEGDRLAAVGDVEMSLIKAQYREAFTAGFTAAVGKLDRRDRNVLRLHLLGGVTLEQLAQMYGVHRATVVRWLAAAREALFSATREHVAATLRAPADELDEMFELVRSRVELSVERLLASVERSHR
jgi:RNA polymerase sigma-70 factor (ECF subfamily)